MMQGGINNAALFGASQRSARSKLDQMAGIKRPSGILASSPELMQAAMPARPPMPPVMQQSPASMVGAPMVPPAMPAGPMMPNIPMPTTVAPRPLNPMAGNPTAGQPVIKLAGGGEPLKGYSDMGERLGERARASVAAGGSPVVDITITPERFASFLKSLNPASAKFLEENIGDEDAIAQAAQKKLNNIEDAAKSKDPAKIADQVLTEAGEKPTDAAKMDFAENVFGLKNVNDIDEINRRIANVAIGSSVAKSPDEFAQAVMLGLQTFKQTASARAEAAADSAGAGLEVGIDLYAKMVDNNASPAEAKDRLNQMGNNLGDRVEAAISGGSPSTSAKPTKESLIAEARSVVERGGDRKKVAERLKTYGIDPGVLD